MEPASARPKRSPLLVLVQALVALGATLGYLIVVLPDYGYEPAWPLNLGSALFLGLLWWLAVRGGHRLLMPGLAIGLAAFVLFIVGDLRMTRAENELRAELERRQYQRLAKTSGQMFDEQDGLGRELHKVFGPDAVEQQPFSLDKPWVIPKPEDFPPMVARVQEKTPGWPRVLRALIRQMNVEVKKRGDREEPYWGRVQVACGHHFATIGGFTHYNALTAYLRTEDRLMRQAEEDREVFLQAWKNRPVER